MITAESLFKYTLGVLLFLALINCGGGGSSSTPITPAANSAPQAGADVTITTQEGAIAVPLNLSAPIDSDSDNLTLIVKAIPTSGTMLKGDGQSVSVGYAIGLGSNIFGPNGRYLAWSKLECSRSRQSEYG